MSCQYVSWCLCPLSRTLHIFGCSLLVLLMSNYKNDFYHWKQPLVQFSQIICEARICCHSENIAFMLSWKSFHWSRTFLTPHKWKGSYSLYWCNRIVPPFFRIFIFYQNLPKFQYVDFPSNKFGGFNILLTSRGLSFTSLEFPKPVKQLNKI